MLKQHAKNIFNDDCLNCVNFFGEKEFDIILTSPPYNIGDNDYARAYGGKYKTLDKDINKNYKDWLSNIIKSYLPKCEYFFLNIQSLAKNKIDIIELLYELKDYYCDTIVWKKPTAVPNGFNERVMTNVIEYIYIFSKWNNSRSVGTKKWNGTIKNVIESSGNMYNEYSKIHKAIMPIGVAEYVVKNFVKEDGSVLDIFGGLGTTAVACEKNNINWVMIEKEKEYCEKMNERLDKLLKE